VKRRVLADTGPLVAILSSVDEHHDACVRALRQLPGPLYTCWPVITEAAWLLRSWPRSVQRLLESCSGAGGGFLQLLPLAGDEAAAIARWMKRYENVGPQLADAALLYLAEREGIDTIFTLDRRDFSVYRSPKGRPFRIVP
jgi:uncharacterized protein